MYKAILLILTVIFVVACNGTIDKDSEKQNRDFKFSFDAIPDKWKTEDSIRIRIAVVSDNQNYVPGQPEIFMPLINHANFDFGKSVISFSWKPDSLKSIPEKQRTIVIKGFFNSKSDSSYIRCSENIVILQDSSGLYYFHREEDSYKLDTFKLE